MTPLSSVAILEKLALLKIAFCSAPAFSNAASRRTSVTTSTGLASCGNRVVIRSNPQPRDRETGIVENGPSRCPRQLRRGIEGVLKLYSRVPYAPYRRKKEM